MSRKIKKSNAKLIISLWDKIYRDDPIKVSDIVADCNKAIEDKIIDADEYDLAQVFLEVSPRARGEQLDGTLIGYWLRSNKDKIINGYKIVKNPYSPKGTAITWELKKV